MHRSQLARIVVWLAVLLCIVWAFSAVVPLQDDELMHYRLLRCMQPGTAISPHDDCTGFWDLNLFGTGLMLPLRVFWYSGVPPAFFYAPLYAVWHSYDSARFLGALFLLLQAWLLGRAYALRTWWAFGALLLFFPYAVQHLADTGPVGYAITSVYVLHALFRRWAAQGRLRWGMASAVVVALGIWIKLVYLWLVPGLAMLWLLAMRDAPVARRTRMAVQAAMTTMLVALLLLPFLLSTDPYQPGRLVVLEQLTGAQTYGLWHLLTHAADIPAFQLLAHPLAAVHRLFVLPPAGLFDGSISLLLYVVTPLCAALIALCKRGPARHDALRSLWFLAAFWITMLCIARARQTWAMHHVILAFPFLILAVCELLSAVRKCGALARRRLTVFATLFAVANLGLYAALPRMTPRSETDWSRTAVHKVLSSDVLSHRYIYVTLDLGMYFYQTTFGPWHQMSIFREPFHQEWQGEQLKEFSSRSGRKLLFYYDTKAHMSDMELLQRMFTLRRCAAIPEDAVWQVLYEPDDTVDTPCEAQP